MTTSTPEEHLSRLERRIDELESRGAIESMHATFVRSVADRRFDGLVEFFADDASIDMRDHGVRIGRSAILQHFRGMADVPLDGAGYVLSSPVIAVDGDHATGVWTWHRFYSQAQVGNGRTVTAWGVWEEGRYDCRYVRVDGSWLFEHMRFRITRPDPDPGAGEAAAS